MTAIRLVAPGIPQRIGPGLLALADAAQSSGAGSGGFSGPYPSDISGLTGWWDAGSLAHLGITSWNTQISAVPNQVSGGAALSVSGTYTTALSPTGPIATARVNGSRGGIISKFLNVDLYYGATHPFVDPGTKYTVPNVRLDKSGAWTLYLVWSRPSVAQYTQATGFSNRALAGPMSLVQSGSSVVVSVGNTGTADALTVFGVSLAANLTARHTHSLTLINTPGVGVDVWLDDAKLNTYAIINTISSVSATTLFFLGDGTSGASSQCIFHEAAMWGRALGSSDLGAMLINSPSVSKRWVRGSHIGGALLVCGQSNAQNFAGDGCDIRMAELIRYYLGVPGFSLLVGPLQGGQGIASATGSQTAAYLTYDAAADPSTWSYAAGGLTFDNFIAGMTPDVLADVCGLWLYWSEGDSELLPGWPNPPDYMGAVKRFLTLFRARAGKTVAQTPVFWARSLPYPGGAVTVTTHRTYIEALANDPTQNVQIVLKQICDALPRNSTYLADGTWTIGTDEGAHLDAVDNAMFAQRAAMDVAANLIRAQVGVDPSLSPPSIPPTGQANGGPQITAAHYEGTAHAATGSVLVTITHDKGTDLKLPLQAVNGFGWQVLDGGGFVLGSAAPGTIVQATAAVRVDANHVRVTLAQTLANASTARLFYPWPNLAASLNSSTYIAGHEPLIGRGDAVTDNYADIPKPDGWDAGSDYGPAWNIDWPLWHAASGVPLS